MEKRRSKSKFWECGVPALAAEQRHLESFRSAQRAARANSYITHTASHHPLPHTNHTHTQ